MTTRTVLFCARAVVLLVLLVVVWLIVTAAPTPEGLVRPATHGDPTPAHIEETP